MENISFLKMNGAGNDFIMIDKDEFPGFEPSAVLIKNICDRNFGIGADGLITINKSGSYDFEMRYFNADGSAGSLCGNGARCSIKYAFIKKKFSGSTTNFTANRSSFKGEILKDGRVRFFLNSPTEIKTGLKIFEQGTNFNAHFINTGSPHLIINIEEEPYRNFLAEKGIDDFEKLPVYNYGKEIRYSKSFQPDGVNVNFIKIDGNKIYIRTYERGVENETLACGTGSAASALIGFIVYNLKSPVEVITVRGVVLRVDFSYDGNRFLNLSLTGPAEVNYEGIFNYNKYVK